MWENFFNHCTGRTVVRDRQGNVWQKALGCEEWLRVGDNACHSPNEISWPVDVLAGGLG
jgi:hypothetical protein